MKVREQCSFNGVCFLSLLAVDALCCEARHRSGLNIAMPHQLSSQNRVRGARRMMENEKWVLSPRKVYYLVKQSLVSLMDSDDDEVSNVS